MSYVIISAFLAAIVVALLIRGMIGSRSARRWTTLTSSAMFDKNDRFSAITVTGLSEGLVIRKVISPTTVALGPKAWWMRPARRLAKARRRMGLRIRRVLGRL